MVDYYFVDDISIFKSLTSKLKDLKIWLWDYLYAVLEGEKTFKKFEVDLKKKLKNLNTEYPRTRPLNLMKCSFKYHGHWVFYIRYQGDKDDLFIIHIKQIHKFIISC